MGILVINNPNGRAMAFDDGNVHGAGAPRWYSKRGAFSSFGGNTEPKIVAARYFPPEPERDVDDHPIPMAYGSMWEGGRPAYRLKVHAAAKKGGEKLGFTKADVDGLKPKEP